MDDQGSGISERCTIYVYVMDDSVSPLRPVEAIRLGADTYRICGPVPDGEDWEFQPDEIVKCKESEIGSGVNFHYGLVAIGKAGK